MKNVITLILLLGTMTIVRSNNLQLGTPIVNGLNELVFTVSWDNSWNTNSAPNNWDGVYLFAKYRDCASTGAWEHVQLTTTFSDHVASAPLEIDNYLIDGKGVLVKRSTLGSGNIANVTVKLKMQTPNTLAASYDFKVFGIEMVYIPTGDFYLGDGSASSRITDGSSGNPLLVTSDGALTRGTAIGNIYCSVASRVPASIPAAFPLGHDSMYVMKYELSQGQWISFLNSLNSGQAAARFSARNANRINYAGSWPNYTTSFPHRAAGFLSWYDMAAYLDWSALRPMTETEFEKICRGTSAPVADEYAWGTSLVSDVTILSNDGTATERNSNVAIGGEGKATYGNTTFFGPLRNGFAATPTSDRLKSGASYYGVMEMSGNSLEMCIGIFHTLGRSYNGTHGDGILTPAGIANTSTWPSTSSTSNGISGKGGSYWSFLYNLEVSDRVTNFAYALAFSRQAYAGGRGIR